MEQVDGSAKQLDSERRLLEPVMTGGVEDARRRVHERLARLPALIDDQLKVVGTTNEGAREIESVIGDPRWTVAIETKVDPDAHRALRRAALARGV
jgi:hypothetical protein